MVCAPARSVVYEYRISTLLPDVFTSIGLKKGFSTTHPLLDKEIYALKRWLAIRSSWPQAASEWLFLSRKGNPLSRQQFYQIIASSGDWQGCHWRSTRTCCGTPVALRWRIWGIDTRLIQDYLGHRNIRHTVWYTASNAGRFYGIWDNPRDKQRSSLIQ